jgi:hypothetical protein
MGAVESYAWIASSSFAIDVRRPQTAFKLDRIRFGMLHGRDGWAQDMEATQAGFGYAPQDLDGR